MWILHWYTVYSPYKHHRTSHVPPWCCHTPPCHGMIHSGMVRGTWQIAQGSDLASELPSSQSNRAFTLEPAPRSHPSRPKGSPVNVLLTGGTGHIERSMSASCWVRVWWTEGDARPGGLNAEAEAWAATATAAEVDDQQQHVRCRSGMLDSDSESGRPPGTVTDCRICYCNCRTWLAHRCERVTHSHNNCNWEVGNFLHNIVAATMAAHLQSDLSALKVWVSVTHQSSFHSLSV